jgi:hypothetical protein
MNRTAQMTSLEIQASKMRLASRSTGANSASILHREAPVASGRCRSGSAQYSSPQITPISASAESRAGVGLFGGCRRRREGRANDNNAADQIALVDAALVQLPGPVRGRVLVRGDAAAGVQALLHHLTNLGLQYAVLPCLGGVGGKRSTPTASRGTVRRWPS